MADHSPCQAAGPHDEAAYDLEGSIALLAAVDHPSFDEVHDAKSEGYRLGFTFTVRNLADEEVIGACSAEP
jgi:hypothetical protein